VARVARVSHQTVSRYLRGVDGMRPELRDRVQAALVQLDYRPNLTARNLRLGSTATIALVLPSLNQSYFAELAQSVIQSARERGLAVFVETTENSRESELTTLARFHRGVVDGVIFASTVLDAGDLVGRVDFPLVLIGDRITGSPFDHVTMSNTDAAREAVAHLVAAGRSRIVALGAERVRLPGAAALRLEGYREALEEAGLPFEDDLIVETGEWLRTSGIEAVEDLLRSGTAFDAIFGFNDALALGALRALLRAGRRVPEDVAIVGFDDTEDARYATPSLSSIAPGREGLAATAVALLVERIAGSKEPPREVRIGYRLQVRESTLVSAQLTSLPGQRLG
jgi:DNA-binding LacI/PurR family transcriptional regulator